MKSIVDIASYTGTISTAGFYAEGGLLYKIGHESTSSSSSTQIGTSVKAGGNITFNAGNNMKQAGDVESTNGGVTYNVTNNLDLVATARFILIDNRSYV